MQAPSRRTAAVASVPSHEPDDRPIEVISFHSLLAAPSSSIAPVAVRAPNVPHDMAEMAAGIDDDADEAPVTRRSSGIFLKGEI